METITRDFVRRGDEKPIASVTLGVPSLEGWTLDGRALPADSAFALANFGLQMLQDAYAGKKLRSEAIAAFKAKYDRLCAGTLGARSAATGSTAVERKAWSLAMRDILADARCKTVAKLADRDDVTDADTGDAYVKVTEGGNVAFNAASMRAYVARHDDAKRYTKRAAIIIAAESGDDMPDIDV
jgi:hypothetical protein